MWSKIKNPDTGKWVSINTTKGKSIINNYMIYSKGAGKKSKCKGLKKSKKPKCVDTVGCIWKKAVYHSSSKGKKRIPGKCVKVEVDQEIYIDDDLDSRFQSLIGLDRKIEKDNKVANVFKVEFPNYESIDYDDIGIYEGKVVNPNPDKEARFDDTYISFMYNITEPTDDYSSRQIKIIDDTNYRRLLDDARKENHKKNMEKTLNNIITLSEPVPKHGDLVENLLESGYRTRGIYIIHNNNGTFSLTDLDRDSYSDEYGTVGKGFSLGKDYPVNYWNNAHFTAANWYYYSEPVGIDIWGGITIKDLHQITNHGNEYITNNLFAAETVLGKLCFEAISAKEVIKTLNAYKKSDLGRKNDYNLFIDQEDYIQKIEGHNCSNGLWGAIKNL